MPTIGSQTREVILSSLVGKSGREARNIIGDLAEQYDLSAAYIYHLTAAVRGGQRKRRTDAGARRVGVTEEQIEWVRALTVKHDITAETAIGLAEINGIVERGTLHPATYNKWLRQIGTTRTRLKRDVVPARSFEAQAPNILHHFDTTKLEQLHYDRKNDELSWNPRANRKNSRGEKPDAIWLYSLIDDHSRCKYAFLYPSLNQHNHLNFFYRAWSEKERPQEFPFYGVPGHLYMDKGGGNQSLKLLSALKTLNVHVVPTTPSTAERHGSRKHGKIERVFRQYNEWIKLFQIRPLKWAEAQESLYRFVIDMNTKTHSVTGTAPFKRWLTIGKPQHTPTEEFYRLFFHDHVTRLVSKYLTFTIDNHVYRLPEERPYIDWVGQYIEAYWNPGDYSKVWAVHQSREIALTENKAEIIRPAFSYPREERVKTAVEVADEKFKEVSNGGIKLFATDAGQAYLPRRGEEFDDGQIAEKVVDDQAEEKGWRPSHAPERWLEFNQVCFWMIEKKIFEPPLTIADRDYVAGLMNGRDKIAESELEQRVKDRVDDWAVNE